MSQSIGRDRVKRFQALMDEKGIGATMIRNIYSFTFVGSATNEKKKAYQAFLEASEAYMHVLKPDTPLDELEKIVQNVFKQHGVEKYYVYGFAHGVGLRFEEDPITTIVVAERKQKTLENMVLNVGHAPLSGKEIGTIKMEDTVLINKEKVKKLTEFKRELLEV